jgi:hypothetical protein
MIGTAVWLPRAQATVEKLVESATDDRSVAESYERITRELRIDADKKGISWGPHRAYSDGTLSVLFEVDDGDCMVKVLAVRLEQ